MADRWYAGAGNPTSRRLIVQRPDSVLRGTVDTRRRTPPSDLVLIPGGAGASTLTGTPLPERRHRVACFTPPTPGSRSVLRLEAIPWRSFRGAGRRALDAALTPDILSAGCPRAPRRGPGSGPGAEADARPRGQAPERARADQETSREKLPRDLRRIPAKVDKQEVRVRGHKGDAEAPELGVEVRLGLLVVGPPLALNEAGRGSTCWTED